LASDLHIQKLIGRRVRISVGIYSLTWVFEFLYHIEPKAQHGMPAVAAAMTKFPATGADEATSIIVTFPTGAHGIATTHLRVSSFRTRRSRRQRHD
jgi:hypothetical protein